MDFKNYWKKDFEVNMDAVRQSFDRMVERADIYIKRLAEYNKDEEIAERDKEIEELNESALFFLTKRQREDLHAFKRHHQEIHDIPDYSVTGNTYLYRVTDTGLGECISIICPVCNEELDVTDFSTW